MEADGKRHDDELLQLVTFSIGEEEFGVDSIIKNYTMGNYAKR